MTHLVPIDLLLKRREEKRKGEERKGEESLIVRSYLHSLSSCVPIPVPLHHTDTDTDTVAVVTAIERSTGVSSIYLNDIRIFIFLTRFRSVQFEVQLLLYVSVELSMQVAVYAQDAFHEVLAQCGVSS